jgi:RNA polymerase sigma factor (TIGR02999 family)
MGDAATTGVTQLLDAVREGDEHAAERLLPLVYEELRKLAHQRMAQEPKGHTLQATALVHEAYLRLVGDQETGWESKGHFFAAAAEAMRRILIERARKYGRQKHGAGAKRMDLMEADAVAGPESVDLLGLDGALGRLEQHDRRMSEIVKLRFFAGLTIEQTALALGVTSRTVNRDWTAAKAWLHHEMTSRQDETGRDDVG